MDKKKAGYLEGSIAIIGNLILFALKYWAGIVSGSVALMADAWHTLSDSISSVVVVLGVKLASRKPDEDHPFGHGRWELVSSIIIAIILVLIAFGFIREAIGHLRIRDSASFGTLALVVTIVSIAFKELMAQFAFYLARKSGSTSVKADGWHHRSDALSSLLILIGILVKDYFWWIDGVLGIAVSLMLMYAAYEILTEAVHKILGEEPDEELIQEIHMLISTLYDYELHPHHFHLHNYISSKELTFHIKIKNSLSVEEGHAIATSIEELLDEKLSLTSTIHLEPLDYAHPND